MGPTKPKRPDANFDKRSLSDAGRVETRRHFETKLDEVARIGRERDDEPNNVEPVLEEQLDGTPPVMHVPPLQRPLERYVQLRAAGHPVTASASAVAGRIPLVTGDRQVDDARARFSALVLGLYFLDQEEHGADVISEWGAAMERTREMRHAIAQWKQSTQVINGTIDAFIRSSEGMAETLLPQLPAAIAYFDIGGQVDALERALGLAAARVCPDIMTKARGTGGQTTRYSLGRVLLALKYGRVFEKNRVVWMPAFSRAERLELVVDQTDSDAANGRDKRYDRALKAYAELQAEMYPETRPPSSGVLEEDDA